MTVLGLDHVAVTCADLERSLRFYCGLLEIPLRERGELRGGSAGEILALPQLVARFADLELGGGRTLELLQFVEPAADGLPEPLRRPPGPGHIALRVDDAQRLHRRLADAGCQVHGDGPVTIDEPGFWHGARAFYVVDPDGVTVELIERP